VKNKKLSGLLNNQISKNKLVRLKFGKNNIK
ncbi:uncharacterized protein METZ01_LOCUS331193, partial [marine metagenome]